MHSLKEADMLATKVDLLTKILENFEKMSAQETIQAMDTHMTCEVCGEAGHSSNFFLETHEDLNFVNNDSSFCPQNQGWNQRSNNQGGNNYNNYSSQHPSDQGNGYPVLKDLVYSQSRMTDCINKKLHTNDKMLENINAKLDDFSSTIKNQLSFNKTLETQLAQLAAAIPSFEKGRIPGKPEEFMETVNLVT